MEIIEKKFVRRCPICSKELFHTTKKHRNRAEKLGQWCAKCRSAEVQSRPASKIIHKLQSERMKKNVGEKNYFYGRHHTQETKEKIVANRDYSIWKTDDFKKKMSEVTSGKNNPMYGRSPYDIWLLKYGKAEADKRMESFRRKKSEQTKGEKNPMYGRPTPQGAGNGWSGWYKGWFFRSLKELSYMIQVIEVMGWQWESAETKELSIPYKDYKGDDRTYRADFLINKDTLVEVKPKKLMTSISNTLKKEAAVQFCEVKGLQYKMVDVKKLPDERIRKLYDSGQIKFTKTYDKKMKEKIKMENAI